MLDVNKKLKKGLSDSGIGSKIQFYSTNFLGATDTLGASKPTLEKEEKKVILKKQLEGIPIMKRAVTLF